MKKLLIAFFAIICSFSTATFAQSNLKTETFKVNGNCDMCKKRIEDAAFVKGVKRAEWNKAKQELTVVYRTDKTNTEAISTSVAKAGHTTEKIAATEKDYQSLPKCCQYKTENCEH